MDHILRKIGLYDFMGIWGPGVICTTYFAVTLYQPLLEALKEMGFTTIHMSTEYFMILLCTIVSYTVGMLINECSRIFADFLGFFRVEYEKGKPIITKKVSRFNIFKSVRYDYYRTIQSSIPKDEFEKIIFDVARREIKNIEKNDSDIHHSIYGMARNITFIFSIHAIATVYFIGKGYQIEFVCVLIDLILGIIFFYRSYKYYYTWIKNMYVVYYTELSKYK